MCYSLYLSTSSREDLTKYNSELLRFKQPESPDEKWTSLLRQEHKWFVGSKSECSCTFRHLCATELSFMEPQDWCPEDAENIQATAELYRVIQGLLASGEQVDCLDVWYGAKSNDVKEMKVALSTVSEKQFLLFENHHFVFEQ